MKIRQFCLRITEKCNSKCIMCDIWKRTAANEFTLEELELMLKNSDFSYLRNISLSGGEPILRDDIVDLVRMFNEYHQIEFILQSNCFATERLINVAKQIDKFAKLTVCCSIDGIGKTHEKIRGIPNAFEKVCRTMEELKKNDINFLISMTIQPENQMQIKDVYEISKKYNVSFWCRPAGVGHYFLKGEQEDINKDIILQQLREINYADNLWLKIVEEYLITGYFPYQCKAGENSCVISSQLNVYPCSHCPEEWKIGSLKDYNYCVEKILVDRPTDKIKNCKNCVNEIAGPPSLPFLRRAVWHFPILRRPISKVPLIKRFL